MLQLRDRLCSAISGKDIQLWLTPILLPVHIRARLSQQGTSSCCGGHEAPALPPRVLLT